ncbi:putative transferase [Helianthus annuus]|nr:putative transferase [Helianthus annuus]
MHVSKQLDFIINVAYMTIAKSCTSQTKMKVTDYLSKFVKPSRPTSTVDRYFKISFFDELAPSMNIPLILYYPTPPKDTKGLYGNICDHLEDTLSRTLSEFYPLAGRYIRKLLLVDCNDQGVLYVLGKANVRLSEILGLGHVLDPGALNSFLPCEVGEVDEVNDPMLSVKVTTFECGGFAIGMCFSHRISDMGAICNFIDNWASRRNGMHKHEMYSPIFNLETCFTQRGLPELDVRMPRSSVGVKTIARHFVFKAKAISAMREKVGFNENGPCSPSKVQLVVALLWKAFVHVDQANNGQSKASFLIQPVGLRDKVLRELPTNSCGNFLTLAPSRLRPGEGENITFPDFFKILRDSVSKTVKDCTKTLTHEEGYEVVIDPYLESNRNMFTNNVVSFYFFTSWCKFSYYQADFGYGKPVWASTGKLPTQNLVIMMDDHDGDGVEAWVHLDQKRMKQLEEDSDIKAYVI